MAPRTKERAVQMKSVRPLFGVWSDKSIAKVFDIPVATVAGWRNAAGVAPYPDDMIAADAAKAAQSRRDAMEDAVLAALWEKQSSKSSEVHRRVSENLGTVSQRHVITVLGRLVKDGVVERNDQGYRKRAKASP
jgi:hypothetical protein